MIDYRYAAKGLQESDCRSQEIVHPKSVQEERALIKPPHQRYAFQTSCIAIAGTATSNAARAFSNQPEDTVYGGPSPAVPKRITLKTLRSMYAKGQPISMVTAYDYPSAVHVSLHTLQVTVMEGREVCSAKGDTSQSSWPPACAQDG